MAGSDGARRGRPADPRLDDEVRRAVRELLAEASWRELTMESLAARAGVARTTLYRRYGSLPGVLASMLGDSHQQVPVPDTGTLRGDLIAVTQQAIEVMQRPEQVDFVSAVFAEHRSRAGEVAQAMERQLAVRRADSMVMIRRAVARGEVSDEAVGDLVLDVIAGLVLQRIVMRKLDPAPQLAEQVVDLVLHGVAAPDGG